jgi:PAS domain S-box-containing protein
LIIQYYINSDTPYVEFHGNTALYQLEDDQVSTKPTYQELEERISELENMANQRKQLEDELRESEEKYSGLFHNSNDAIFVHDLKGNITDVNQRALELFGYTKPEMFALKVSMLHPPESHEKTQWAFASIIKNGYARFESEFINKSGIIIPVEVSSSSFVIGGKTVIQGIVRDIRERNEAELARQEAFNIIEKSPVAAFLWRNEEGWPVEFVTRNVQRIFGYTDDDFLAGRVFYNKLIHPEDLELVLDSSNKCNTPASKGFQRSQTSQDLSWR